VTDLTEEEVRALARALALPVHEGDLVEVTHRLNLIISGVDSISDPELDAVEPVLFPYPGASDHG